jgi:hypothetical protein
MSQVLALILIAQSFQFTKLREGETIAEITMASPGSDWGVAGREAAVAALSVDKKSPHHVVAWSGEKPVTYSVFLGRLAAGDHTLTITRDAKLSAAGSQLKVSQVQFRDAMPRDPVNYAPILFARPDTIGTFSDVPLLAYCEQLPGEVLQFTVIFSNEDGGTSTRALMARWGRTTDIEYIYRVRLKDGLATMQAKDHKDVEFTGRREGNHPLLIPSTRNNMVSGEGESAMRFQLAPIVADLTRSAREQVMDSVPLTYRVAAAELEREGKLRPFGAVDSQKISDPRNYLYLEARIVNQHSALATVVRIQGEDFWRTSHLGRVDYAIERDGWVRTTVELPPGAKIAEIGFECLVADEKPQRAVSGTCRVERVSKAFFLDRDYQPQPSIWSLAQPVEIPTGRLHRFQLP